MGKILIALVIVSLCFGGAEFVREREKKEKASIFPRTGGFWMETYLPGIRRMFDGGHGKAEGDVFERGLLMQYPALLFLMENGRAGVTESDYARLLLPEGSDEDRKGVPEEALDYEEDALHLEGSMESALQEENNRYLTAQEEAERQTQEEAAEETEEDDERMFVQAEEKSYRYRWEDLTDYQSLIKAFYAVDSTTVAGEELLRADALLEKDMSIHGSTDAPQILIYHTHSKESFVDSVPGDENNGIVGAGEYLAKLLRERYGYNVIHNSGCYDEDRDYAYSNSLPAIESILAENPSIEAVIDLHRDEMPKDRRLVLDMQGRPTAQFMFFNGLCRTKKGPIEQLENPYLADNLSLSFQMQAACNEYYPGIARRIYLKAYRYNMHLCPKSLLIELGAQNNTEEEIHNACDVLAHVLHLVFSGKEPEQE